MDLKLPFEPIVLAHSTSWTDNNLMTVLVPIPTVKLAEIRTHRDSFQHESMVFELTSNDHGLSLNANSSRAIPIEKQLKNTEVPFVPIWTSNQPGMQGKYIEDKAIQEGLTKAWLDQLRNDEGSDKSITDTLDYFADNNVHKQDASLLLNPYSWTSCVITADRNGWLNFFSLRCPLYQTPVTTSLGFAKSKKELISWHGNDENVSILKDPNFDWSSINTSMTYPAIQVLAERLYDLYRENEPVLLKAGEWHCPFIDVDINTLTGYDVVNHLKLSMSKCAMISYANEGKEEPLDKHVVRANKLISARHWSTAEHQYRVPTLSEIAEGTLDTTYRHSTSSRPQLTRGKYVSNIEGWIQLRKIIEAEELKDE